MARTLLPPSNLVARGPGRVVGIASGYGLDAWEIESQWEQGILHMSTPALGTNQPPIKWLPGLSRGKVRPGVTLVCYNILMP